MHLAPLRRLRSVAAVAIVSIGLIVAVATPASAVNIWIFGDNFENNPGATWSFQHGEGASSGVFTNTNGYAHSGEYYANMRQVEPGWMSLNHNLSLPGTVFTRRCTARAWFMPLPDVPLASIEIINPTDWTYVAQSTFTLVPPYLAFWERSMSWSGGPKDVVIRFVLPNYGGIGNPSTAVKIDDVNVTCTY